MHYQNKKESWDTVWHRKDLFTRIIDAGREFYNIFFRRLLMRHLTPESEMIELGCGSSTLSLSIAKNITRFTGIDNSPEALALSEKYASAKNLNNVSFVYGDILSLPDELKNKFDLVWSQGLMEHFSDYLPVVRAHYEAAKPGGTVLLSVPYQYSYIYPWYLLTRNKILARFWPYIEQRFLTLRELRELGKQVSKNYKAYFLKPTIAGILLGIVILEIKKEGAKG